MHPYKSLPSHAFWKHAVAGGTAFSTEKMWDPKFQISESDNIATYGSCFAQHFGRALEARGLNWFRPEVPVFGMSKANLTSYGYNLFSSRTGNIYTTSQMLQWIEWAADPKKYPSEIWCKNGRYFDSIRPTLEPNGFASEEEVVTARSVTCAAFHRSITQSQIFVFTLGLTESWVNKKQGFEYGICPSPANFEPDSHEFKNMSYPEVEAALAEAISKLRAMNPDLKILLTVSPVPLVATASGKHVLAATTHSKAILRAVAGQAAADYEFVDYFPSFEIINNPMSRGVFFEQNMRSVNDVGVSCVMDTFFTAQSQKFGSPPTKGAPRERAQSSALDEKLTDDDIVCEEELLSAFGDGK